MPEQNAVSVFLCYNPQSKQHAHVVYRKLRHAGVNVRMDSDSIRVDRAWTTEIFIVLKRTSHILYLHGQEGSLMDFGESEDSLPFVSSLRTLPQPFVSMQVSTYKEGQVEQALHRLSIVANGGEASGYQRDYKEETVFHSLLIPLTTSRNSRRLALWYDAILQHSEKIIDLSLEEYRESLVPAADSGRDTLSYAGSRSQTKTILVVDSQLAFFRRIEAPLRQMGFNIQYANDEITAMSLLKQMRVDVALVNVSIPDSGNAQDYSGIPVAYQIQPLTRVVMMADNPTFEMANQTLATRPNQAAPALRLMSKHGSLPETVAILNEVLALPHENDGTWHPNSSARFRLHLLMRFAVVDDIAIALNEREYKIVSYFMSNPARVISREEFVSEILQDRYYADADGNRVNNIISRLRKKIEPRAKEHQFIYTKWGGGFVFFVNGEVPEHY